MMYFAKVSMKVGVPQPDGTLRYVVRRPGEAIPEAFNWPDPGLWVKRGYLRVDDNTPYTELPHRAPPGVRPTNERDKLIRALRHEIKEIESSSGGMPNQDEYARQRAAHAQLAKLGVPMASTDFIPNEQAVIGAGDKPPAVTDDVHPLDTAPDSPLPGYAADAPPSTYGEPVRSIATPEAEAQSLEDLQKEVTVTLASMTAKQLRDIIAEKGLTAAKKASKPELIQTILASAG